MIKVINDDKAIHVVKGWGEEVILHNSSDFCTKILKFNKIDGKGSLHFHSKKSELFRVLNGSFVVIYTNTNDGSEEKVQLKTGQNLYISTNQPHQIICETPGEILECSTFDSIDDSYRISQGDSQKQ